MEVLFAEKGQQVKSTKKGSGKSKHVALWKKFAAQLDTPSARKAKLAAPQTSSLAVKSDEQLQLLEAVLTRTKGPSQKQTGKAREINGQLMRPTTPIPHGHIVKQDGKAEELAEKKKAQDKKGENLDAMLNLLALDLSQSKQKTRSATQAATAAGASTAHTRTAQSGSRHSVHARGALGESQVPISPRASKPSAEILKPMSHAPGELLAPGAGSTMAQLLSVMGIDPNKLTHLPETGITAAMAELRNRAEGKHTLVPPDKKIRGRAPSAEAARNKTPRVPQRKETPPGIESVEVENRWEKLLGKLNSESGSARKSSEARGERSASANLASSEPEPLPSPTRLRGEGQSRASAPDPFAKAIQTASVTIERSFAETQQARKAQASTAPETVTRREEKGTPRPHRQTTTPEAPKGDAHLRPHDMTLDFTARTRRRGESAAPEPVSNANLAPTATKSTENLVAAAKPAPAPPQPMFSQVEAGMRHAYIVRPKSVTVRIVPEELGEIQIKVTMENEKVHARIQTESQKVVAILKDHQAELQQRMQSQGIDLEKLEVRHQDTSPNSDHNKQNQAFQSDLDQQNREKQRANQGENQQAEQGTGPRRAPRIESEPLAASTLEPVSIFDANGRVSLTA